ncbi:MAG: hypothetical protein KKB38_20100 [Gammaproteobacteria bacterium]|nr:hypothetical protein [Gammaproteobacteria bacterium]
MAKKEKVPASPPASPNRGESLGGPVKKKIVEAKKKLVERVVIEHPDSHTTVVRKVKEYVTY